MLHFETPYEARGSGWASDRRSLCACLRASLQSTARRLLRTEAVAQTRAERVLVVDFNNDGSEKRQTGGVEHLATALGAASGPRSTRFDGKHPVLVSSYTTRTGRDRVGVSTTPAVCAQARRGASLRGCCAHQQPSLSLRRLELTAGVFRRAMPAHGVWSSPRDRPARAPARRAGRGLLQAHDARPASRSSGQESGRERDTGARMK